MIPIYCAESESGVYRVAMSESVTEHIRREQEKIKRPDAELTVVNPEHGPVSIELVYVERELGAVVIDQTSVG